MNSVITCPRKALVPVGLILVVCISIWAQVATESPKLLYSLEQPNCEYLLLHLDTFTTQFDEHSVGHIVLYGGRDPIQNVKYEKYLKGYVMRRRLGPTRVTVIIADPAEKLRVEFWVSPPGHSPPIPSAELTRRLRKSDDPIVFDGDLFERYVEDKKISFIGYGCEACCITNLDWTILQEFLIANPNTNAYVVIRGPRTTARQLRQFLAREIQESGISSKRVVYLFAKKNLASSERLNEVEVFITRSQVTSATAFKTRDFAPDAE